MSNKVTLQQLLDDYQQLPEFQGIILKDVTQRGGFNSTPLHIAIYREKIDEVQLFLEAKADPNASGEYGERPLQVAINCGNREVVERLLLAGAKPELKDDKGKDAWQVATVVGFRKEFDDIICRMRNQAPEKGS